MKIIAMDLGKSREEKLDNQKDSSSILGYNDDYSNKNEFSKIDINGNRINDSSNINSTGVIGDINEISKLKTDALNKFQDEGKLGNSLLGLGSAKDVDISNSKKNVIELRGEKILKSFNNEYTYIFNDGNVDKKNTLRTIEENGLKDFYPNNKSFEENKIIDNLKNKNNFLKNVGRIHVKPIAGKKSFDIPFEYSPQISSEQMTASYVSERILNRIGQFFVYTGTNLSQLNINLEYEALAPDYMDEIEQDNLGKQFATDTWQYYWTSARINEMEYKLRSLVLPDVTSDKASIIVPPIIEIIMSNDSNSRVRDLYKYPDSVGRSIGNKYLSVTKALGDKDIYKKYIVTSVQIEYRNKDINFASYYGRNIEDKYPLNVEENLDRLTFRRGFKASIQCTEVTANFLDVAPDFVAYYDAWSSDLGELRANEISSKVESWAEKYTGPNSMSLEDKRNNMLGSLNQRISILQRDLENYFKEAASIAAKFEGMGFGELTNKFLDESHPEPFEYMDPKKRYFMVSLKADYEDGNIDGGSTYGYENERLTELLRSNNENYSEYIAKIKVNSKLNEDPYMKALGLDSLPIESEEEKEYPDVSCVVLEHKIDDMIEKFNPNDVFITINVDPETIEKNYTDMFANAGITSNDAGKIEEVEDIAFPKDESEFITKFAKLQSEAIESIGANQLICSDRFINGPKPETELPNYSKYIAYLQNKDEESKSIIDNYKNVDVFSFNFDSNIKELYTKIVELIKQEPDFGIKDVFEEVTIPIPLGSDMSFIQDNVPLRNLPSKVIEDILHMAETINDLEAHLVNTNGLLSVDLRYSGKEEFSGDETVEIKNPGEIDNNYYISKLPESIKNELKTLSNDKDLVINVKSVENGLLQVQVGYDENKEFSGNERISINKPEDVDGNRSLNKLPSSIKEELKKMETSSNIDISNKDGILTMKVEYEK